MGHARHDAHDDQVLGIEQFTVAHDKGSSHGLSRIIRLQYHEHPDYVPLLRRAYELWHALEQETSRVCLGAPCIAMCTCMADESLLASACCPLQKLLHMTGCLEFADPAAKPDNCFATALLSCEEHGLEHEVLSAEQVNARFPGYHLPANFRVRPRTISSPLTTQERDDCQPEQTGSSTWPR